jgi:hypothetical protein
MTIDTVRRKVRHPKASGVFGELCRSVLAETSRYFSK